MVNQRSKRRRRVRKGTHSCWECRRRKIRCQYATPSDIICVGCCARGTACVSQDHEESTAESPRSEEPQREGDVLDRLQRLEEAMESLIGEVKGLSRSLMTSERPTGSRILHQDHLRRPRKGIRSGPGTIGDIIGSRQSEETPMAAMIGIRDALAQHQSLNIERPTTASQHATEADIHKILVELSPPRDVARALVLVSPGATLVTTFFHTAHEISQGRFQKPIDLALGPPADCHPIALAKWLLELAICVQQLPPGCDSFTADEQEYLRGSMVETVNTVTELVTSRDDFVLSLEGLQCLVLLAFFQLNAGNLRRSWLMIRRAVNCSQLLGLSDGATARLRSLITTVSSEVKPSPQWLWYRVVFFDRYLSLVLGLPAGVHGDSFVDSSRSENETPMERLEKTQTVLTGRILERNSTIKSNRNEVFSLTQLIDCELDAAAEEMGVEWWNPAHITPGDMASISHTLLQIHQHTLKLFLHLPYLLRRESGFGSGRYEHSRVTCASASRSVLRLFVPYRTHHPSASACRHVDHSALISAMTLLLGYLADQPPYLEAPANNTRETQRLIDLQLVKSVRDRLLLVAESNRDGVCRESADFIARLIPIIGSDSSRRVSSGQEENSPEERLITFEVPYIGEVVIRPWVLDSTNIISISSSGPTPRSIMTNNQPNDSELPGLDILSPSLSTPSATLHTDTTSLHGASVPHGPTALDAEPLQMFSPIFHADETTEFWPLQGLDTNFWNLLQQGMGDDSMT